MKKYFAYRFGGQGSSWGPCPETRGRRQWPSPVLDEDRTSVLDAFFAQGHSDITANFSHCFKEWVTEGTYTQSITAPTALHLYEVALDAGHSPPDVAEGDTGKEETPEQGKRHAQCSRQNPVAPVLADGEGGVAGLPHTIKAVGALWLSDHIFKVHLSRLKDKL